VTAFRRNEWLFPLITCNISKLIKRGVRLTYSKAHPSSFLTRRNSRRCVVLTTLPLQPPKLRMGLSHTYASLPCRQKQIMRWYTQFNPLGTALNHTNETLNRHRVTKKSLCTWWLYCNRQVHRDVLITLYKNSRPITVSKFIVWTKNYLQEYDTRICRGGAC